MKRFWLLPAAALAARGALAQGCPSKPITFAIAFAATAQLDPTTAPLRS